MNGMAGTGGAGRGDGREDLASRLLGWWLRLEHWWRR
jgi:hypothetical protein